MSSRVPFDTTVRVLWATTSEKVSATTDHALLVLPDGDPDPASSDSAHRLYFSGTPLRQAQMISVVVDYMVRSGLGPLVKRILFENPDDQPARGAGEPIRFCPSCGRTHEEL